MEGVRGSCAAGLGRSLLNCKVLLNPQKNHLEQLCAVWGSLAPVKTLNLVNIGCFRHSPAVLFAGVFVLAAGGILPGPASLSIDGPGVPHHWPAGGTSPVAPLRHPEKR